MSHPYSVYFLNQRNFPKIDVNTVIYTINYRCSDQQTLLLRLARPVGGAIRNVIYDIMHYSHSLNKNKHIFAVNQFFHKCPIAQAPTRNLHTLKPTFTWVCVL